MDVAYTYCLYTNPLARNKGEDKKKFSSMIYEYNGDGITDSGY